MGKSEPGRKYLPSIVQIRRKEDRRVFLTNLDIGSVILLVQKISQKRLQVKGGFYPEKGEKRGFSQYSLHQPKKAGLSEFTMQKRGEASKEKRNQGKEGRKKLFFNCLK